MRFPDGFLWGAATAAHQIEGNNIGNNWWELEHSDRGVVTEPSGDACDSYHRYAEDIALLADVGLRAYRFSIEWSRIEPESGHFSAAALAHYRRMIETCLSAGVEPIVTLHHFTSPRWFHHAGGWVGDRAVRDFARYVENVLPILTDGVRYVCTINEPNIAVLMRHLMTPVNPSAARLGAPDEQMAETFIAAHEQAVRLVRSIGAQAGWTVATQAFQPEAGAERTAEQYAWLRETAFLRAARNDDFLGVQAYTRTRIGPDGPLPPPDGSVRTLTDWEYYPPALAEGVAEAWRQAPGVPILVTENGIATTDDEQRIAYTTDALRGLAEAIHDGVDVRGYLHWSWLDNFEWASGYRPTFGLVAVDRSSFARTPKPSAHWLGRVAAQNGVEDA